MPGTERSPAAACGPANRLRCSKAATSISTRSIPSSTSSSRQRSNPGRTDSMKRLTGALFSLLVLALPAAAQENGTVVVRGGWLFDGVRDARVRNPGIVIRGGVIIKVAPPTDADLAGAQIVVVTDSQTILPGFIDVHGHY